MPPLAKSSSPPLFHSPPAAFQWILLTGVVLHGVTLYLVARCIHSTSTTSLNLDNHVLLVSAITTLFLGCLFEHYFATKGQLWQSIQTNIIQQPYDALKMMIPALLTRVHIILIYVAVRDVPFTLVSMCQKFTLLVTAMVSVRMLRNRTYSIQQWTCLVTFCLGGTILIPEAGRDLPIRTLFVILKGLGALTMASVCYVMANVYFEKVIKNENTHTIIVCGNSDTVLSVDTVVASGVDASEDGENSPPEPATTRSSLSSLVTTQSYPGTIPEMAASRSTLVGATAAAAAAFVCFFQKIDGRSSESTPSFWMRNIQFSCFTLLAALLKEGWSAMFFESSVDGEEVPYFHEFTVSVWILVALQVCGGILHAAVRKYTDCVMLGLALGVSSCVWGFVSTILWDDPMVPHFPEGAALIVFSIFFFSIPIIKRKE